MSITDLKALELSWFIEARKFPAAPALFCRFRKERKTKKGLWLGLDWVFV